MPVSGNVPQQQQSNTGKEDERGGRGSVSESVGRYAQAKNERPPIQYSSLDGTNQTPWMPCLWRWSGGISFHSTTSHPNSTTQYNSNTIKRTIMNPYFHFKAFRTHHQVDSYARRCSYQHTSKHNISASYISKRVEPFIAKWMRLSKMPIPSLLLRTRPTSTSSDGAARTKFTY